MRLPAAGFHQVAARTPRFVVDDPVPTGRIDLTQIRAREMIPLLRKVVVGRIEFRSQHRL